MTTKKKTTSKKSNKKQEAPEKLKAFRYVFQDLEKNNTTVGGEKVSEWGAEPYFGYWDDEAEEWVRLAKLVFADGAEMDVSEGYFKKYYHGTDSEALDQVVECAQKDMERNEEWSK